MNNEAFKKFRKTGKIEDYLKYRSEMSKELHIEKEKKKDGNKGNSNKKS